jgi:hypothetical protein
MLQVELVTQIYEGSPGMTEMLRFIEQYGFAPVAVSPSPLDHMGPGGAVGPSGNSDIRFRNQYPKQFLRLKALS